MWSLDCTWDTDADNLELLTIYPTGATDDLFKLDLLMLYPTGPRDDLFPLDLLTDN